MKTIHFILGLLGIIVSLAFLSYFAESKHLYEQDRIFSSLGSGVGGLLGALVWGSVVWFSIRVIRGANKAPEIKSFLFKFSAIFCVIYILAKMNGMLPD